MLKQLLAILALLMLLILVPNANAGQKQELTVTTVSHNVQEVPRGTHCSVSTYGTNTYANCRDTAFYFFTEVVRSKDGTQYTLTRWAKYIWSSTDQLEDGYSFPAKIDGGSMTIFYQQGGNQGPRKSLKFKIMDIRPTPVATPEKK